MFYNPLKNIKTVNKHKKKRKKTVIYNNQKCILELFILF